jgi:hypothetical protein
MIAPWEEPWSRLLAFREHLPENYEIPEALVRTYHDLAAQLEHAMGIVLTNFRISPDEIRPKVVSARMGGMRRPGHVNYSKDNYCLRTTLLMQLDGLIRFLEPRLKMPKIHVAHDSAVPLYQYEKLALTLFGFIESAGKGRWRPTSIGDLYNITKTEQELVVDELKREHSEAVLDIRKWSDAARGFIPYTDTPGADAEFFYRHGFELRVLPRGRPWFEELERRAAQQSQVGTESKRESFSMQAGLEQTRPTPKAFISYAWEGKELQAWVRELAVRLRGDGVDVTLDQWALQPGDQLPTFMENSVRDNDYILIIWHTGLQAPVR